MITTSENPQSEAIAMKQEKWGARLKATREAMRLSEKDAATWLHLKPHIITTIESENFENGPPAIFMRGYLRSYARLLNFTEQEINQALIELNLAAPMSTAISPPRIHSYPINSSHHYMRWVTFLIMVILGGLVGMWWNNHSRFTVSDIPNKLLPPVVSDSSEATTQPQASAPATDAAAAITNGSNMPSNPAEPTTNTATTDQTLTNTPTTQSPANTTQNLTPAMTNLPNTAITPIVPPLDQQQTQIQTDTAPETESPPATTTHHKHESDDLEMVAPEPGLEPAN